MSSGGGEEGNCRLCDSYTKNVEYKWRGLCLACADKIDNWSKEELVSEISKLKKEIWPMKYGGGEKKALFCDVKKLSSFECHNCGWKGKGEETAVDLDVDCDEDENNLCCPDCEDLVEEYK